MRDKRPRLRAVRAWDQEKAIRWFRENADFRSKTISQLVDARKINLEIKRPNADSYPMSYRSTKTNRKYQRRAALFTRSKLRKIGLLKRRNYSALEIHKNLESELKEWFH